MAVIDSEATTTAAQTALQALAKAGVDVVFGNPGTTELPLIKEFARTDSLRYVLALHEGAATAAAAGHALATGRPAVAMVHAMPGLGNAMSMYYNAWRSGVPLVLIAGSQHRRLQHLDPVLQADLVDVARSISKRVWEVKTAEDLPEVLVRALEDAAAPPSGPVFLSVPIDLWSEAVDPVDPRPARPSAQLGPAATEGVEALTEFLLEASAPVIVTGDLVGRRRCGDLAAELAELVGAPAHWAPQASLASMPSTSDCYRGPIFADAGSFARVFAKADAVLGIGANIVPSILFERPDLIPASVRAASITETPAEALGVLVPEVALHGDLPATLRLVIDSLRARLDADPKAGAAVSTRRDAVLADGAAKRSRLRRSALDATAPDGFVAPRAAVATILEAAPDDVFVVDEAVSSSGWVSLLGSFSDPLGYTTLSKGGALGYAVGVAAGVSVGSPGRPGLVILGDGALMYGPQALWTIANEELPIVTCVLNNNGYQILKDFMVSPHFSPELATEDADRDDLAAQLAPLRIEGPVLDLAGLARSCGMESVRVQDLESCRDAVEAAFASGSPWLIDISVTASERG
jgi:benzoylformate decarboxylase